MDIKLLALISLNYCSTYLAYSFFPPYLPKIAHDEVGLGESTIGMIMSFWYVGYSACAVLMSHILRYTGRKNAVILGLILLSFDFILASLCTKMKTETTFVISFCFVRFLNGVSQAFVQVTTYCIIATCFRENIAKVVGIIEFSWGTGIAIGPLLNEFLYNSGGFHLPCYVHAGLMLVLSGVTWLFMTENIEGHSEDDDETKDFHQTDSSISMQSIDQDNRDKISFMELFTYKLFIFGLLCSFFNLILYTLLEPLLTNRLLEMGVKEKNLGEYFCIQPFVYSGISILVDTLILKHMSKRLCLILGFIVFAIGFLFTGPSAIIMIEPSLHVVCLGLVLLGIGCSLSFVPIFPELIESVISDYTDRVEDLNNTVASIMNASYGSAALGQLIGGFLTQHLNFVRTCEIFGLVSFAFAIIYLVFGHLPTLKARVVKMEEVKDEEKTRESNDIQIKMDTETNRSEDVGGHEILYD
ncbi:unnamed protein product [Moneuplotes crassus]|uniref:Major facilitator superfamily (MFS) profile domain-containing protein n=1 Tax=Euplotes crassus TaxID=5936 RepID=A0AAD1XD38_EUPCR|nr:unnamed protein product [Moneuplotes crassus]